MIIMTIEKLDDDGNASPSSEMRFSSNASINTEVIPSLFKSPEFIGGTIIWLESDYMFKRNLTGAEPRALKVPIRRCNSGLSSYIGEKMFSMFQDCGDLIRVINSKGEKFKVEISENNAKTAPDTPDTDTRTEPVQASVTIKPITVSATSDKSGSRLASVPADVREDVSCNL